jgi:soluble lytic murein transglycosylase
MRIRMRIIILLAVLCCAAPAFAQKALTNQLSSSDVAVWQRALNLAEKGQHSAAQSAANEASRQELRPVLRWMAIRQDDTPDVRGLAKFILEHPDFPRVENLKAKVEQLLVVSGDAGLARAWFRKFPAETPDGHYAYLLYAAESGEKAALARDVWGKERMSAAEEDRFLDKYGQYLTAEDHRHRLDTLLWYRAGSEVSRQKARVGRYADVANAWQQAQARRGNAMAIYRSVDDLAGDNPGFLHELAAWQRKAGNDEAAQYFLSKARGTLDKEFAKAAWKEREVQARIQYRLRDYKGAYAIAANNALPVGAEYSEAEFFAGWMALSRLKQPGLAAKHFEAVLTNAQTPITKARGAYWLGKANVALGRREKANELFAFAARNPVTFYGQLAAKEAGISLRLPQVPMPSDVVAAQFYKTPMVSIVRQLAQLGNRKLLNQFAVQLYENQETDDGRVLVGSMLVSLRYPSLAVRVAKRSKNDGVVLPAAEFPLVVLPENIRSPEAALIFGIIRQESEFDPVVASPVGAAGLMQLMPATAAREARAAGIAFSRARLKEPTYNVVLGSQHLDRLLNEYNGNYPMVAGAYNAGGGNVNKWNKTFGDPRRGEIDIVDWIESIPFQETRNYVQRVLEGVEVYRLRLEEYPMAKTPTPAHPNAWCAATCRIARRG